MQGRTAELAAAQMALQMNPEDLVRKQTMMWYDLMDRIILQRPQIDIQMSFSSVSASKYANGTVGMDESMASQQVGSYSQSMTNGHTTTTTTTTTATNGQTDADAWLQLPAGVTYDGDSMLVTSLGESQVRIESILSRLGLEWQNMTISHLLAELRYSLE